MSAIKEMKPGVRYPMYNKVLDKMSMIKPIDINGKWFYRIKSHIYYPTFGNKILMIQKRNKQMVSWEDINFIEDDESIIITHCDCRLPKISQTTYFRADGSVFKRQGNVIGIEKSFYIDENGYFYSEKGEIVQESYPTTWENVSVTRAVAIKSYLSNRLESPQIDELQPEEKPKQKEIHIINIKR